MNRNDARLSTDDHAQALSEHLQRCGLGFTGVAGYCGNENKLGLEEAPKWQSWADKSTSVDQQRIESCLADCNIIDKNILHVGVGNSSLARLFHAQAKYILGITIYDQEKNFADQFRLENYDVAIINKYSPEVCQLKEQFDLIIDNNPLSFACCLHHFSRMMLAYYDLLSDPGELVTAQPGWGWILAPGAKHAQTAAGPSPGWDEWAALAGVLELHAKRVNEFVYTMGHSGGRSVLARAPVGQATRRSEPATPRLPLPNGSGLDTVLEELVRLIGELKAVVAELHELGTDEPDGETGAGQLPPPDGLQQKLTPLFAWPVAAVVRRTLTPFEEVTPGVKVGFDAGADLALTVAPKRDPAASPADWKNSVAFWVGGAGWFSIEVHLAASELVLGERCQLALCARSSRAVGCRLILRQGEQYNDQMIKEFRLHPAERCYNMSGNYIPLRPDRSGNALNIIVLAIFESSSAFSIEIDYLNLYFA